MSNFTKAKTYAIKKCSNIFDEEMFKEIRKNPFREIYPFTTENIAGYIDNFDLKDKSLLTVGSSGDQVINAIMKGCKDITVLDMNHYIKYYYYLKIAGIISLEYEEFQNFFRYVNYPKRFNENINVFNIESFKKLKDILRILDYESYLLWDELFQNFRNTTIRTKLFSNDEDTSKEINNNNTYMVNETSFNQTKDIVHKIKPNFVVGDVFEIKPTRKFDNIWLSNISSYHTIKKLKKLVDLLDLNLNKDGKMLIGYLYYTSIYINNLENMLEIYSSEETLELFKEYEAKYISFTSVSQDHKKDSILIYQKNK